MTNSSEHPISVIILAAGLGTRMKSKVAKVLHRAGGLCLVEHIVRTALELTPPERITVVVGHQSERVRGEIGRHGVRFAFQTEQRGTGHAVLKCAGLKGLQEGLIIVLYGDCPLLSAFALKALVAAHEAASCAATVITAHLEDPAGYGRIIRDADGSVAAIVEERAATAGQKAIREINSGVYCFDAAVLWPHLAAVPPNPASGEIYLTDVIERMRASGHKTRPYPVGDPKQILGINSRVELAEIDRILRERKVRELMLAGVTIEKPETVMVDLDVNVGRDTQIGPFVELRGHTEIGEDCQVGACSILENARLENAVTVYPFTTVLDSALAAGSSVGPFARLRMNSVVERGAHIGNFVELKNTKFGAGSMAMHLAYLGDAKIGSNVNVGAGTITCNFDGWKKNPTEIADDAFVGSNSTLVAPVKIGQGSYVGAGSVITEDVPSDALALGRERQVVKPGWARKRRQKHGK